MGGYDLMAEAARLARESVVNEWGGPFGAVISRDGEIIATGQNRVLLTGDLTAHAEIEAIRKAIVVLNGDSPTIPKSRRGLSTLALTPLREADPHAPSSRARMLSGLEIYSTGQPCPMCLGAIYWARLEACYFACDVEMTKAIGFDDSFLYDEFALPLEKRRILTEQRFAELGLEPYQLWMSKGDRHYY